MITYSSFRPTGFDASGAFLDDRQDWLVVPVTRNRCSEALDRANFKAALQDLGGEGPNVEVHRFGHWANGWFEIILVRPESKQHGIATEIVSRLEDYPVLDDDLFSAEEYAEAIELWRQSSVEDRLHYIKRCGADPKVSMFAARRDELPRGIYASELIQP